MQRRYRRPSLSHGIGDRAGRGKAAIGRLLAPFSGCPRFVPRYRPPAPPPLRPRRQHRYDHEHHCEGDEDGERRIDVQRGKEKSDEKTQQDDTDYSTRLDHPGQYEPLVPAVSADFSADAKNRYLEAVSRKPGCDRIEPGAINARTFTKDEVPS
jgi:hypothetical protein